MCVYKQIHTYQCVYRHKHIDIIICRLKSPTYGKDVAKRALYIHEPLHCQHIVCDVILCIFAKEPCISAKEPYLSGKEPCISTKEP